MATLLNLLFVDDTEHHKDLKVTFSNISTHSWMYSTVSLLHDVFFILCLKISGKGKLFEAKIILSQKTPLYSIENPISFSFDPIFPNSSTTQRKFSQTSDAFMSLQIFNFL